MINPLHRIRGCLIVLAVDGESADAQIVGWASKTERLTMHHHKDYKSAIEEFYLQLSPYAHVVIAPNFPLNAFNSATSANASLKRIVREIALRLDHRYFGTRRLIRDINATDRFDAICWPEKLVANPHVDCSFFLNPQAIEGLSAADRKSAETDRLTYLLSSMRSQDVELAEADKELLRLHPPRQIDEQLRQHFRKLVPGGSCSVTGVHNIAGLARYSSKEYNVSRAEEGSSFFFLSDFHSTPRLIRTPAKL